MSEASVTERKGSLMKWTAECGHSMVVYSLEPTPPACPDCADKGRKSLESWRCDIGSAESHAMDTFMSDVRGWMADAGITFPDDVMGNLEQVSSVCSDAYDMLSDAYRDLNRIIADMPRAERLSMEADK